MSYRTTLQIAFFSVCFVFLIYSAFWFAINHGFKQNSKNIEANLAKQGVIFTNGIPPLKGYPFTPRLEYTGDIVFPDGSVIVPKMVIKGYFIPGRDLKITFPDGFAVDGTLYPTLANVDYFQVNIETPYALPASNTVQDVMNWQARYRGITVNALTVKRGTLHIAGDGFIGLDDDLQINARFDSRIRGHEEFVELLARERVIQEQDAQIALIGMRGLSSKDVLSGDSVLEIPMTIENQTFYLGPVAVARLAPILWDTHNLPVLPLR